MDEETRMTDRETLDKAKALFTGATQGDKLAREVIAIAERHAKKAALWEELAGQRELEISALTAQQDAQWEKVQAEADSTSPYSYTVAEKVKPQT